jgi:hypothetical protein
MTDRIRELLKNQGVKFTRETAEVQLKRAGVTLSADWSRRTPGKSVTEGTAAPDRRFTDPRGGRARKA